MVNICKKNNYGQSPLFMGKLSISMAMFHIDVNFLEGTGLKNLYNVITYNWEFP